MNLFYNQIPSFIVFLVCIFAMRTVRCFSKEYRQNVHIVILKNNQTCAKKTKNKVLTKNIFCHKCFFLTFFLQFTKCQ